jgi:hypothetical protein
MKTATAHWRLFFCVLLLSQAGCSWWRHRQAPAADLALPATPASAANEAAAGAAPATEPVPAPEPAALSEAQAKSASALATDFYQMHIRMSARGLPGPGTMNAYAAFLCPGLVSAIGDARGRQQQFIQAHPQEKPPLVEGDLFSSLFEGADSANALEATGTDSGARVTVALGRGKGADAARWKDDLVLERDDQLWCVADVEYRGDWQFANRGRLSDRLKAE